MRKTLFGSDLCPVIPSPHESLLTAQDAPPVRTKTFSTHNRSKFGHDVRRKRFNAHVGIHVAQDRAGTEGGAGIGSRKEGTHASGEDRRNPPSPPGRIKEAPGRPHERQPALGHEE